VYEHGSNYVCSKSVPTLAQPTPTCDFKSGKIILQQPVEPEQMSKLLETGKTDLLDKFVSMRTRRSFKAFLAWNAQENKVSFEFEPRVSKYPARKTKTPFGQAAASKPAGKTAGKSAAKSPAAKKTSATAKKAVKSAAVKAPRKAAVGNLTPSAELAAVIGEGKVARTEVIKKIWDYIKTHNLQDSANKRAINADAKLRPVFGKDQITMFELAGIVGKHMSA
jgi:DNA topoisomerase-3